MSLYLLPTKTDKRYAGPNPNKIVSASYGGDNRDVDGKPCIHIETNCGERFTVSRDRLEADCSVEGFVSRNLTDICANNTVLHTLSQERYDEWLQKIQAQRLLKARLGRRAFK